MAPASVMVQIGSTHLHGTIETTSWPLDGSRAEVLVRLDDGRQMLVPFVALYRQQDGSYVLSLPMDEPEQPSATNSTDRGRSVVVPVMVEELTVQKRTVETGRVRIKKIVHEREELVDEALFREEVTVERVPINRIVEEPIPLRYEGDTIIVSLLEEVLVVEKRLMLKEELRITRQPIEDRKALPVTLRSEEAIVEYIKTRNPEEHSSIEENHDGEDSSRAI